jgi:GH25 family lysozyme M1 (1,4-beta-N-acetylmuramidase)
MSDLVVVDISHYQPTPDFDALLAGGIVGVILKCTEGTSYLDNTFHDRYAAARAAGLCVSSYHFLRHGDVANQMAWYLDQCAPDWGERVVIDYEHTECTVDDLVAAVQYLLTDERFLQVTCYGASKLSDDCNGADEGQRQVLSKTALWAARYSSNQPVICTSVWPAWSLWQFTDSANVPGISGPVDGNRFNGSDEACIKWMGPAEPAPQPEPEPGPEPTENAIALYAPDNCLVEVHGTGLTVVLNGVVLAAPDDTT